MTFLVHFGCFSWCILSFIDVKRPKVLKLIQVFDFEGVWNELFAKKSFLRQSWTKYIGNLKELQENGKVLKKAIARYLWFFKICDQKLSSYMGTGN